MSSREYNPNNPMSLNDAAHIVIVGPHARFLCPNGATLPDRYRILRRPVELGENPIRSLPNSPNLKNPTINDLEFNIAGVRFSKDVSLPDSFVRHALLVPYEQVYFQDPSRPIGRAPFLCDVLSDSECEVWKSKSLLRDAYISEIHYKNRTTVTNMPVFHNGVLQTYLRKILWPTGEIHFYSPDGT